MKMYHGKVFIHVHFTTSMQARIAKHTFNLLQISFFHSNTPSFVVIECVYAQSDQSPSATRPALAHNPTRHIRGGLDYSVIQESTQGAGI